MVFWSVLISVITLAPPAAGAAELKGDWTYVARKLARAGLPADFTAALKASYDPGQITTVVELNTLLFLRTRDDHGSQATTEGAARVAEFVRAQAEVFAKAERRYHVDPAVIASLLYIESRFGQNVGRFRVPSVFLDLVQADQHRVLRHLHLAAPRFAGRVKVSPARRREIDRRAARKVAWALGELKALHKIWRRDPDVLGRLNGSFAGAIGMPQFLPSSFLKYARAADGAATPDLSRTADAVESVANYLAKSGWRKSPRRALFAYNHSRDYARAILKLAVDARAVGRTPSAARR